MPRHVVTVRCELENLARLSLAGGVRWQLHTKCSNCGEEHRDVWCDPAVLHEVDGSRGEAHVVMRCAMCERQNTIVMEPEEGPSYASGGEPARFAVFEGRGVEVVGWAPGEGLTAETDGGRSFDVALEDGEWYDFDDESGEPVSVTALEVAVVPEGGGKKGGKKKKRK